MNYEQLDDEEKMKLAREYALAIGSDLKTPYILIGELAVMFSLSFSMARLAYVMSNQIFRKEWLQIRRKKIIFLFVLLISSLIIGIFSLFIGQLDYFVVQWALGVIFLVGAVSVMRTIILIFRQEKELKINSPENT
jgi:hypothetical protein